MNVVCPETSPPASAPMPSPVGTPMWVHALQIFAIHWSAAKAWNTPSRFSAIGNCQNIGENWWLHVVPMHALRGMLSMLSWRWNWVEKLSPLNGLFVSHLHGFTTTWKTSYSWTIYDWGYLHHPNELLESSDGDCIGQTVLKKRLSSCLQRAL